MISIRIHGRGGQGVVTAAELLSVAAFLEGRHAQAIPSFGSERTGAPVVAFCRVDDRPIRSREPVVRPDCVIVQDATLIRHIDVFAGLTGDGFALINATGPVEVPPGSGVAGHRLRTVPATGIALRHLGRPVPNAALLGGFVALTGLLRLDSVLAAVRHRFPGRLAEPNVDAARAAYEYVLSSVDAAAKEPSRA